MPSEYVANLIRSLAASPLLRDRHRPFLLRRTGVRTHGHVTVETGLTLFGDGQLELGPSSYVNRDCLIDLSDDVRLGRSVALGSRVSLITSGHELDDPERRAGVRHTRPIEIGDGAWLGADVTVLPGTTIGAGAMVGAGAVVTSDVPPHELWGGVPARHIRHLD